MVFGSVLKNLSGGLKRPQFNFGNMSKWKGKLPKGGKINFHLPHLNKPRMPSRKQTLRFLFSEVGLLLLIIGYTVGGAFLFRWIEYPAEWDAYNQTRAAAAEIETARQQLIVDVQNLTADFLDHTAGDLTYEHPNQTYDQLRALVEDYHALIVTAIDGGYDGTVHEEGDEQYGWSVSSAVLFTASILTTIGYGHIAPASEIGQAVTIAYSVLSIPLMSIFLTKVGKFMIHVIGFIYMRMICVVCAKRRLRVYGYSHWEDYKKMQLTAKPGEEEDEGARLPALLVILLVLVYCVIGTVIFWSWIEDWTLIGSLYCTIVTLTTIGFGDMVPGKEQGDTTAGKLLLVFTAVYVVVGLAVLAIAIAVAIQAVIRIRHLHQSDTPVEYHVPPDKQLVEEVQPVDEADDEPIDLIVPVTPVNRPRSAAPSAKSRWSIQDVQPAEEPLEDADDRRSSRRRRRHSSRRSSSRSPKPHSSHSKRSKSGKRNKSPRRSKSSTPAPDDPAAAKAPRHRKKSKRLSPRSLPSGRRLYGSDTSIGLPPVVAD